MRPILITGATGFIGRRLARRLLDRQAPLRLMVRDPGRLDSLLRARTEVVVGELGDEESARRAMRGVGHVLHLAAMAKAFTRDPDDYDRLNCQAVGILLEAAARAGVQRFVHVSSIAALPAAVPPSPSVSRGSGGTPLAQR